MNASSISARGGRGFRQRVAPVFLAVAVGLAAGTARAVVGFLPGMHGMFFGGLLGWLAGRRARGGDPAWWTPGQRFWLWLNLCMTCACATWMTLSLLYRRPLTGVLEWLGDVVRGAAGEPFFGARPFSPIEGVLSGGGWIAFNALDLALCFALGHVVLGVTVDRLVPETARKARRNADAPAASASRPSARRGFIVQWAAIALGVAVLHVPWGRPVPARLDEAARARLASYTGRYFFEDGAGLLEPAGQGGSFLAQRRGWDGLVLLSEPAGRYTAALDYDGRAFHGRLSRGGSPVRVRARISRDGRRLFLAGPEVRRRRIRGEVLVEARKE